VYRTTTEADPNRQALAREQAAEEAAERAALERERAADQERQRREHLISGGDWLRMW
jgi:hypothetical protein